MTAATTTAVGSTIAVVLLLAAVAAIFAAGMSFQRFRDRRELRRDLDSRVEEWSAAGMTGLLTTADREAMTASRRRLEAAFDELPEMQGPA